MGFTLQYGHPPGGAARPALGGGGRRGLPGVGECGLHYRRICRHQRRRPHALSKCELVSRNAAGGRRAVGRGSCFTKFSILFLVLHFTVFLEVLPCIGMPRCLL